MEGRFRCGVRSQGPAGDRLPVGGSVQGFLPTLSQISQHSDSRGCWRLFSHRPESSGPPKELPETDQFLRGLRAWVGFKQTGVDYVRPQRAFGKSTGNFRKNLWWARKAIFSFSFVPIEALLYAGSLLTLFSLLGVVWQVVYRVLHPELPHGISTIILLVLLFGGGNMLAISVLGEYVAKVVEETKRRPKFIRRAIRAGDDYLTTRETMDKFLALRASAWTT